MKTSIRLISILMVVLFSISIFAGCGNNGNESGNTTSSTVSNTSAQNSTAESTPVATTYEENGLPKDEQVTLKVGFFEGGNGRAWYDYCVETFTKAFPNVKFETQYSPTISDVVKTKVAAGNDEDMFDIFYYQDSPSLARDGKLEPLDDLFDRAPYDAADKKLKDILVPGIYENLSLVNNKLYYWPLTTYVGGLFFDEGFFDQNGWNKDPKTWDEFLKLCADINAKGVAPIAFASMYKYDGFAFTPKEFEIAEKNGKNDYLKQFRGYGVYNMPYYSSPESLERWNREYELGKQGYIDSSSVSINHTQSQMMMLQHKAAMVPTGDWVANEMKDSVPEGFKWGYMAVPFINDPNQKLYLSNGISNTLCVYSKKPELNKKWSKEFMLWLCNADSQLAIVEKGGALAIRKDLGDTSSANIAPIQKKVTEYIKNHNVAFVDIYGTDVSLTDPNYTKATKLIADNVGLMATGKKEPGAVLAEADKILQAAVDAYKKAGK